MRALRASSASASVKPSTRSSARSLPSPTKASSRPAHNRSVQFDFSSKKNVVGTTVQRRYNSDFSSVKTIGVIGAGQMGAGIAQVAAQIAKVNVLLTDARSETLSKSMGFIGSILDKNVAKGKMTAQDKDDTLKRIKTVSALEDLKEADFLIEAVKEDEQVKSKVFETLARVTPPHAILASNTSSISITKIAAYTNRPERVIGMHFMNPVPVMKLVEIIPGLATSTETLNLTLALAKGMGKITTTSADTPGFIANRLLMPYINEAVTALQEGVGTKEDIDTTMKLGTNVPMGPLELADFIGLDTCLAIMRVLHSQLGDSKYRPSPLLTKYVDAGWLGKKSGRGFFNYSKK